MNSFLFLKGGPTLCPFGPFLDPCSSSVDQWSVLDPYWLICDPLLDRGPFLGFRGPLVNFWSDHCWTVLDSWVISSLGFQLELFGA